MFLQSHRPTVVLSRFAIATCIGLIAHPALAQVINGTATYRERMAMPSGAVFEAVIEDVSRADAPATTFASTRIMSPGNPPIAFAIEYEPAKVLPDRRYVVRARILLGDQIMFVSDTAAPVLTRGSPTSVNILLRRVASAQSGSGAGAPSPAGKAALEGTYWRAIELAGKPVPALNEKREANLVFQSGGRLSASDGCNRLTGSYTLKGDDGVTFGQMAGTQMACLDSGETERAFRAALKGASRWRIEGDRLELFDAAGTRLAAFSAGSR
jgi:putative lipoprotein